MREGTRQRGGITGLLAWVVLLLAALGGRAVEEAPDTAAGKLYNGNALYNMKLYSAATAEYQNFLAANPQHAKADEARFGLALSLYGLGKFAEAEPLLKQLLASGKVGDPQQLLVLLGDSVNRLRGPTESEKIFSDPAALQGTNTCYRNLALAYLTESLFRQQKWEATAAAADRALTLLSKDDLAARVGYQGAYARYQLKQMDAAAAGFGALLPAVTNTPIEVQTTFLLGECLRETGKPAEAEKAYGQAAAKAQGDLLEESLFRLGVVRFSLGRYDEAASTLTRCLTGNPSNRVAEASLYLGRALLEQSKFGEAEKTLLKVSQSKGVLSAEATLWLSRAYARQNRTDEACKLLADNLPRFTSDPLLADLLFEQAGLYMAGQKYAEAADSFQRIETAYQAWPRLAEVLRLHALCAHRTKEYTASVALCDRFLATATNVSASADVLFLKAESQYLANPAKPDDALTFYKEFQVRFPKEPKNGDAVSLRIGQILHGNGAWKEALEHLLALRTRPAQEGDDKVFGEVPFLIGDCYFRQEQWDQAVAPLEDYAKLTSSTAPKKPNADTALVELALAHVKLGKPDAAKSDLEQLIERDPQSRHLAVALSELGRLYYEGKRPREARLCLERVAKEFPEAPQRPQAEYYVGWLNLDEKADGLAETNFLQVVKQVPADPLAADSRLQLGLLFLRAQRFKEAGEQLAALRSAFPAFAKMDEVVYSAGVALARQDQNDQAADLFKTVLDKYPKAAMADRAAYELAWCHRRANRKEAAVKVYDTLLQRYPQSPVVERARFEMAELSFDAKDFDAVIGQLKQTITGATDKNLKEQAMYRLGWAYLSKNDPEAAAQAFEAMLAEFSASEKSAMAHYQAGEMRVKLKAFEPALVHFTAALANPEAKEIRESALIRQGEMQTLTGKFSDASATYLLVQSEFPASKWIQQARFGAGWALENQRQYERAMAEYRKVIAERASDELSVRSQFQIGECLFGLERYDEAMQELVRVDVNYKAPAWSGKALFEVGRALEAKGDQARAAEQYRAVMDRFQKEDVGAAARTRLFELQSAATVIAPKTHQAK
ncbi:MAG: tetratricopeptide repeat protein [bacterium]